MKKYITLASGLAVLSVTGIASANCNENLTPSEALGRNQWALSCGYSIPASFANNSATFVSFSPAAPRTAGAACGTVVLALVDFCPSYDCYTPDQEILVNGQYVGIEGAAAAGSRTVTTLASDAPEGSLELTESPVTRFTVAEVESSLITLLGEGGERLEVTVGHPIVKADGSVVPARSLAVGDLVAGADGKAIHLASVTIEPYEGAVWNVELSSRNKLENVIVAEGFLAGSLMFQERWADDEFRLHIRDALDVDHLSFSNRDKGLPPSAVSVER